MLLRKRITFVACSGQYIAYCIYTLHIRSYIMYSTYICILCTYVSFYGTTCAYAQRIYVLSSWRGSSCRCRHHPRAYLTLLHDQAHSAPHIQTLYIFLNLVIKNKYIYVFVQWHTFVCIYTRCRFSIYIIKESIKKKHTQRKLIYVVPFTAFTKIIIMKTHVLCRAQIERAGCATRRDG